MMMMMRPAGGRGGEVHVHSRRTALKIDTARGDEDGLGQSVHRKHQFYAEDRPFARMRRFVNVNRSVSVDIPDYTSI